MDAPATPSNQAAIYLRVTIVVTVAMVIGALLEWVPDDPSPWRWLPLGIAYLVGGVPIARDTLETLREGRLSIDFLMGAAALGAAAVGQPLEGVILIFLFSLSNTLEAHALGHTRRAIGALMELHPEEATLLDEEGEEVGTVDTATLRPGQRILVRPGERLAADGTVRDGRSEVDQAAITGEAIPVGKGPGDGVFAGTINQSGALVVEVARHPDDTMLARIVRLVEEARDQRAPAQEFIDRFAHPYTLLVLVGSAATALVAWAVFQMPVGDAVYRAMTVLVVASPCALVISTPSAILSGIANGARHGVLFKGGAHLDLCGTIDTVAFDKTGTLTEGSPRLLAMRTLVSAATAPEFGGEAQGGSEEESELLRLVAAVERPSEHHLARAVVTAARERGLEIPAVEDFRASPGRGVEGRVEGRELWVGNAGLAESRGAELPAELEGWLGRESELGRSVVVTGDGDRMLGALSFGDTLREGAAAALAELREGGVRRIVVLSGDRDASVRAVTAGLGLEEVRAELLPDEKVDAVRALRDSSVGVAMVGDGVNDAPAMMTANVGIAMGAAGTDVAIETADVVLMSDDLAMVPYALRLGRRARRVVRQNVWFSVGWMAILIVVASTVGIPLTLAVVAHEGSTLLVVLNGLRLLGGGRNPAPAVFSPSRFDA